MTTQWRNVLAGLVWVLGLLPAAGRAAQPQTYVFTPPEWPQPLSGDLYRPASCTACPVVLLIHGGGWRSGKRTHMHAFAADLQARGYAAFSIDYRLVPAYIFPAQLDDVRLALEWLQAQAPALGLDAQRIGAWGYSAGAHLAALAALTTETPRVRAVVAGGLPADLVAAADSPLVQRFLGGTLEQMPERYRAASPLHQVDANAPPMFLYHARWDWIVSSEHPRRMQAALASAGVDHALEWLGWRGHIAGFFWPGAAREHALDFLDRHLRFAPP
ncbi:Acetyl esterase/lipase [Fontimonas thermophila]|uniref:Acetyl esterase/lipase n=1 Tax=Fontimonas thermophila TaxID=1076937 RepID=A0A1I2K3N6_9GAMM|nr:alpha/beta hydrolase [Fontimonas thermophila]SFF59671.1 Acetyl esterase/lipase [Fontimonas thermophila]